MSTTDDNVYDHDDIATLREFCDEKRSSGTIGRTIGTVELVGTSLAAKESIPSIFPSCSLKITDVLALLLLRQNPTDRWIGIVTSHMYPAVVQSGKNKEKETTRNAASIP